MPFGNETAMQDDERARFHAYINGKEAVDA